jgi:hypothetical protein
MREHPRGERPKPGGNTVTNDGLTRRATLQSLAVAAGIAGAAAATAVKADTGSEATARDTDYLPDGADRLRSFTRALAGIRRRRGGRKAPMILTKSSQWDSEAMDLVLGYGGNQKHVFDTTDLAGTWLTQIRNTMNAEAFALGHPNFLMVVTPHGPAQYSLYDRAAWDKYDIAALTGGAFKHNTFIKDPKVTKAQVKDVEDPTGLYSDTLGNFIPVLQKRGVVFCACHNAVWELAGTLIGNGVNPDKRSQRELTADLTNALIPGVVLTPGNEAIVGLLERAGFSYSFAA